MAKAIEKLSRHYGASLQQFLACEDEALLYQAYELGRQAFAKGFGVMDMAKVHQDALEKILLSRLISEGSLRAWRAQIFFMETVSPFEMANLGFKDTDQKLRELVKTLEKGNRELAGANQKLKKQVAQRARAEEALRRSKEHYRVLFKQTHIVQQNMQQLSDQLLLVQEAERKRLSRELHDEIGQALTAIHVNLVVLQHGGTNAQEFKRRIIEVQQLVTQTMESVHRFACDLRPAILDELGLVPALRSYLQDFEQRTGLRTNLNASLSVESLDSECKLVIYRVAQESLTNVAKHAAAKSVMVTLLPVKESVRMEIKDDGRAFPADKLFAENGRKRLGLLGMEERVHLVKGVFTIDSNPGQGTTVRVRIPFPMCEATRERIPPGKNRLAGLTQSAG